MNSFPSFLPSARVSILICSRKVNGLKYRVNAGTFRCAATLGVPAPGPALAPESLIAAKSFWARTHEIRSKSRSRIRSEEGRPVCPLHALRYYLNSAARAPVQNRLMHRRFRLLILLAVSSATALRAAPDQPDSARCARASGASGAAHADDSRRGGGAGERCCSSVEQRFRQSFRDRRAKRGHHRGDKKGRRQRCLVGRFVLSGAG